MFTLTPVSLTRWVKFSWEYLLEFSKKTKSTPDSKAWAADSWKKPEVRNLVWKSLYRLDKFFSLYNLWYCKCLTNLVSLVPFIIITVTFNLCMFRRAFPKEQICRHFLGEKYVYPTQIFASSEKTFSRYLRSFVQFDRFSSRKGKKGQQNKIKFLRLIH